MSPAQRRALRSIPGILQRDIARTDRELAGLTGLTHSELRSVLMVLYRQHLIDFAAGYVVATVNAPQQRRAA